MRLIIFLALFILFSVYLNNFVSANSQGISITVKVIDDIDNNYSVNVSEIVNNKTLTGNYISEVMFPLRKPLLGAALASILIILIIFLIANRIKK
jgi:hypothetical protein